MKHYYSLFKAALSAVLLVFATAVMAEDVVYDFSTSIPEGWTASVAPNVFETTSSARGAQFLSSVSNEVSLVLKGAKDVCKVTVECSCNNGGEGSAIAISVGGSEWGTEALPKVTGKKVSFADETSDGDVEILLTIPTKSIWIKNVTLTCGSVEGGEEGGDDPIVTPPAEIQHLTIAQFLEKADTKTTYELTGIVKNITSTKYGNFDLVDETGSIYIYGLLDKDGQAQNFESLGIAEGDEVTLTGVYYAYVKDGVTTDEIKNAQFVSMKKGEGGDDPIVTPPAEIQHLTIAQFLEKADTKTTYELTGTVKNITSTTYGNFDLVDETASIYIYGLLDKDGKAQNFASLNIAEGDEVTLTGVYYAYEKDGVTLDEIKNAKFVSVKKAEGGEEGGGDDEQDELDPNYEYDEPTIVTVTGPQGFNSAYSFISNNIKVESTKGARTIDYFGCNADNSITFTATKPIKAIVVNGYVKMGFEAEASSGNIMYVDASEGEVENDPVLAVLNVDSESVTISCMKQLRCYSVEVYFDENPEISGGGEGDYSYDYEPDDTQTLDIQYDGVLITDYTEDLGLDYTDLYFMCDDYEMELGVFAPLAENGHIAPGEYPISFSYEPGTVEASVGGDDMYDYASFIATDFEYYEGETEEESFWYYTTSFYLIEGKLTVTIEGNTIKYVLDAQTAKGSTVHAIYTETLEGGDDEDAIASVDADASSLQPRKLLTKDGKLLINKAGKTYNTSGVILK